MSDKFLQHALKQAAKKQKEANHMRKIQNAARTLKHKRYGGHSELATDTDWDAVMTSAHNHSNRFFDDKRVKGCNASIESVIFKATDRFA